MKNYPNFFLEKMASFFRVGPLPPGSLFGKHPKGNPPREGGLPTINLMAGIYVSYINMN